MPNWITVRVKAKNPQIFSEKFLSSFTQKEIEDEENLSDNGEELSKKVDFNVLTPSPSDLSIVAGGVQYQDENDYYDFQKEEVERQKTFITPLLEKTFKEGMTQEEYVKATLPNCLKNHKDKFLQVYKINSIDEEDLTNVLRGFYNKRVYGNVNWYDFHVTKWGTKWNATTIYVDEESGFAEFQTAWSCPFEILEELAKYTDIAVSYADEDTGSNYGVYEIVDGVRIDYISSSRYMELNNVQKINAIATATALTMGEIYDINEDIFGHYEDGEFNDYFNMPKEQVLKIAQVSVNDTQKVLSQLGLFA